MAEQFTPIGRRIRKVRKQRGMTIKETAQEIGISRSYLSQIELEDVKSPGLQTILGITDALDISIAELFNEESKESNMVIPKVNQETKEALQLFQEILTDTEIPTGQIRKIREELVNHAKWLRAQQKEHDFNE